MHDTTIIIHQTVQTSRKMYRAQHAFQITSFVQTIFCCDKWLKELKWRNAKNAKTRGISMWLCTFTYFTYINEFHV